MEVEAVAVFFLSGWRLEGWALGGSRVGQILVGLGWVVAAPYGWRSLRNLTDLGGQLNG